MKNQIILIYKKDIEDEKIIFDINLLQKLNYQKIIIKIINDINDKNYFLTQDLWNIIFKKIKKFEYLNILWNIEINHNNLFLLKQLDKKYPIFIDYFFHEKEYDYITINEYKKNVVRIDANIFCNISIEEKIFDNIDYYDRTINQTSNFNNEFFFTNETIILYFDNIYFLYLFGNKRFFNSNYFYHDLSDYYFYQKEIIKWKMKKQQQNKICKDCNFLNACNNQGFFIFENPINHCDILEYLKNND